MRHEYNPNHKLLLIRDLGFLSLYRVHEYWMVANKLIDTKINGLELTPYMLYVTKYREAGERFMYDLFFEDIEMKNRRINKRTGIQNPIPIAGKIIVDIIQLAEARFN